MSSVSISEGLWSWSPATGRWQTRDDGPVEPSYAAVDSWLVAEGYVRGVDVHRARFAQAVAAAGAHAAPTVGRFLDAVIAVLPRTGRWFPRVELTAGDGDGNGVLRLRLRPAPAPLGAVLVLGVPSLDARRWPQTKGPDLSVQQRLRRQAVAAGAGETLLVAPDGAVREGVWTTPVWWEDDVLYALPEDAPVLGSVTRALLFQLAVEHGVVVAREAPSVARLQACETWLLSALHGIRVVTGWVPIAGAAPIPAPVQVGRADRWRARLEALAEPLS